MTDITEYADMPHADFEALHASTLDTLSELEKAADKAEAVARKAIADFQAAPDEQLAARKMVAEQHGANAQAALRTTRVETAGIIAEGKRREHARTRAKHLDAYHEQRAQIGAGIDRIVDLVAEFRTSLSAEVDVIHRLKHQNHQTCACLGAEHAPVHHEYLNRLLAQALEAKFGNPRNYEVYQATMRLIAPSDGRKPFRVVADIHTPCTPEAELAR